MIVLLTDYGWGGPYVGQLHAVAIERAPDVRIVDLVHTLPAFDIRSTAYLLPAYTRLLPEGSVIVCVVDPGVGSLRPHAVVAVDGRFYVGPDNGSFDVLMRQSDQAVKYHFDWPDPASRTFHGRDVYVPAACHIVREGGWGGLALKPADEMVLDLPADFDAIIYIDSFGNAITGRRAQGVARDASIQLGGSTLPHACTFSDVPVGSCFWYENANGLVEIAANQGSAAEILGLKVGDEFDLAPGG